MKKIIAACLLLVIACVWIPLFSSCAFFRERNPYLIQQNDAAKFIGAIRPYRGDSESHYSFGCYLQERNKHELAVEEFLRAVEIKPTAKAYNGMGVSYDSLRDYAKAIEAYNAALMMEPKLDYVYNNLGYAYLLNGDLESAIKNFKLAVALKRGKGLYHNNLGLAYAMSGKYNLALDEFKLAVGEDRAHASLAKIIRQNGRHDEGSKLFASAPAIKPPDRTNKSEEGEKTRTENIRQSVSAQKEERVIPGTGHEAAAQIVAAPVVNPSDKTNNGQLGEKILSDIFMGSRSVSTNEQKILSTGDESISLESRHKSAAQIDSSPVINPSDRGYYLRANNSEEAEKKLAEIFAVRQPASIKKEEIIVTETKHIDDATITLPFVGFVQNSAKGLEQASRTNGSSARVQEITDTVRTQAASIIRIEVSNGNGVNRMARRVGEFLRGKGFLPSRLTNAENFNQLKTRIYYSKGYQDQACKVASCLPEGHSIEMVQRPPKGNEVIRVVIGRDLVPYRALFQRR